jgi:hypothetical protein
LKGKIGTGDPLAGYRDSEVVQRLIVNFVLNLGIPLAIGVHID